MTVPTGMLNRSEMSRWLRSSSSISSSTARCLGESASIASRTSRLSTRASKSWLPAAGSGSGSPEGASGREALRRSRSTDTRRAIVKMNVFTEPFSGS